MSKILTLLSAALLSLGIMGSPQAADKKTVVLGYVEWDDATTTAYLAKTALEERLNVSVELMPVSAAALWVGVASGDIDGMLTAWLPVTHQAYAKKLKGKYEDLGPLVGGARLGLVVPSYVTISSIEELAASADKFDGKIVGVDPGAGIMGVTEATMKAYGIKNMELADGSGAIMTSALADAIRQEKWIVVTGWSPHWMFGRWELKYLQDPKGTMGGEESIHAVVRSGLKDAHPEVYAFFDHFRYETPDQLQKLMAQNQEKGADFKGNSQRFMQENPQLVDSWFVR